MSEEAFSEELKAGNGICGYGQSMTWAAPGRFLCAVNDIDIRKYGSQGQQRTAALSLKLAQIQLMRKFKETPILLLMMFCLNLTVIGRRIYWRVSQDTDDDYLYRSG